MVKVTPGFTNILLFDKVFISPDSLPYSFSLPVYAALTGIILLYSQKKRGVSCIQIWTQALRVIPFPLCFVAIVLIGTAFSFHYIRFDPKYNPAIFLPWAWCNLFFTCTAEEAFFRGFLQKEFTATFHTIKGGTWIALALSSILFGCAHYQGGFAYVILSTLAGLGYGYVYLRSQVIESSIFLHFLVNAIHFIGFSYPALNHS